MNGKGTHNLQLEVIPSSMMDLSYFDKSDPSHKITIVEIEKLSDGDIFVDVGANIGYLSLIASKQVGSKGRVMSFEPSPREYKRLLNNIAMNCANNIVTYHMALGSNTGEISFSVAAFHTGLNKIANESVNENKITVPMFRFEDVYKSEKEITLMKIDVEGAEYQVLDGMKNLLFEKKIKKIVVEITPKYLEEFGSSKEQLYALMERYNYVSTFDSSEWQYDEIFQRQF